MPVFKSHTAFEIFRSVTAFLNLEVGLTRGGVPAPIVAEPRGKRESGSRHAVERPQRAACIDPANIVWIFGAGRTGSTWLANMMNEMPHTAFWNEPMIGSLFGNFRRKAQAGQLGSKNFILGDPARESWSRLIREFILGSANDRFPNLGSRGLLLVKEPNSSMGAPLIMEAVPESCLIFLIRDPRDVVASALDGAREGGWLYTRKDRGKRGEASLADEDPDTFAQNRAKQYLNNITGAREAFESHGGYKTLVRYEELRADTLGTMKRIYSDLGLSVGGEELVRAVEKHTWENIPEDQKGEGKKFRKATPGGWSEDLTSRQIKTVERITAQVLEEFYADEHIG